MEMNTRRNGCMHIAMEIPYEAAEVQAAGRGSTHGVVQI